MIDRLVRAVRTVRPWAAAADCPPGIATTEACPAPAWGLRGTAPAAYRVQAQEMRLRGIRRWRMSAWVFLIYLAYALPDLFDRDPTHIAVGLLLIVGFVSMYLGPLPHGMFGLDDAARRWPVWTMTGIAALYLLVEGGEGVVFATYLCVAYVMLLPIRAAIPLVLAICAAVITLPQHVAAWHVHGELWAAGVPALLVSVAMVGIRLNAGSMVELYRARAEVEQLAADQERLRIARDLHDLLGHALTTVIVKADLAARLAPIDPERAAREMREVATLARGGLADVRGVVTGYREVSLLGEIATAREVLRAAGIEAELPTSDEDVAPELKDLFGWVVREGVTNAVRHSRAGHLRIELGERSIEITDDGRGASPDAGEGNGLRGVRERAGAAGARVDAGAVAGGGWRLRVEVPARDRVRA